MSYTSQRHPLYCIIPPHIFANIARNGSPEERDAAIVALEHDHSRRAQRTITSMLERPPIAAVVTLPIPHENREIYDCQHRTSTPPPWPLLRHEGQGPVADLSANRAYDWLGATFDLYWKVYHRNSIDNHGRVLNAGVHFGNKTDNAYYNGAYMLFGDGDGVYFKDFTIPIDVAGHELTHGVTACEANLIYQNQPGALNESISDVFGTLVKQWSRKEPAAKADWLIGEGLFTSKVHGVALRSMKAPGTAYNDPVLGKDPQPANMAHYVNTTTDNGGVHINSGIPSHAFYLAAMAIGGYAWQKAGLIWYETLCDHPTLHQNASFVQFANLTIRHARLRFGNGSLEHKAVYGAWRSVGLGVTPILPEEFEKEAAQV
jgi:Zn-dependent metalloprotease